MDSLYRNRKKKGPPECYKQQRLIGSLLRAMYTRGQKYGWDQTDVYYMISMEWWARYKVRMRLDGPDMPEHDVTNPDMDEIDNHNLTSSNGISPSAIPNVTCTYVTEQIWNLLSGWYAVLVHSACDYNMQVWWRSSCDGNPQKNDTCTRETCSLDIGIMVLENPSGKLLITQQALLL